MDMTMGMTKDKIEIGSKWVSKVDEPLGADIYTGEVVVVESVDSVRKEIVYEAQSDLDTWYSNTLEWHNHFKPYVEEKLMNKITVGSKWVAKVDHPYLTGTRLGEIVEVTHHLKSDTLYFNNKWYGRFSDWYDNFKPYGEEDVQEDFTLGDNVNNPSHYGQGKIEAIEYIKDFLTKEEYIGNLRGNIAKYLHRWRYKNGIEDLKKAKVYLEWLIDEVTDAQASPNT